MVIFGGRLVTRLCISTRIAVESKKLLRDIVSLIGSDYSGIVRGFYSRRRECSRRMGLSRNS